VVGRISFFVNAGVRFVEEMCKLRAFARLWDEITRERYGIEDPALRRFRYGVQVNSLGLTEAQPENNVQRIVLEMLGVTLSRDARARALRGTRLWALRRTRTGDVSLRGLTTRSSPWPEEGRTRLPGRRCGPRSRLPRHRPARHRSSGVPGNRPSRGAHRRRGP